MISFSQEYAAHVKHGFVMEDLDVELRVKKDADVQAILDRGLYKGAPGAKKLSHDREYAYALHVADMNARFEEVVK